MTDVTLSKLLSLILRHQPERFGLSLDHDGFVEIDRLLAALAAHHRPVSRAEIDQVVATNDKQRFALSPDGRRIRAVQGHSRPVELRLVPHEPPPMLYHGTVARFLAGIRRDGLTRQRRQHVHLSADVAAAEAVGGRRGEAIILVIDAGAMQRDGHLFYRSENGVWLCDTVLPRYIAWPTDQARRAE